MRCPKCGKEMWIVQYPQDHPEHHDGFSEYACFNDGGCNLRIGRWSGKELKICKDIEDWEYEKNI